MGSLLCKCTCTCRVCKGIVWPCICPLCHLQLPAHTLNEGAPSIIWPHHWLIRTYQMKVELIYASVCFWTIPIYSLLSLFFGLVAGVPLKPQRPSKAVINSKLIVANQNRDNYRPKTWGSNMFQNFFRGLCNQIHVSSFFKLFFPAGQSWCLPL